MSDLERVRAVLRALKAKTVEHGCTEEEAMAAAEKMAELLSRHSLSEDDLVEAEYCETRVGIGRRSPLDSVWGAVARFADCRGYYVRGGKLSYAFFGRAQDVLVAEYVYQVLRAACDQALAAFRRTDTYTRRRTAKTRNHAVKAFLEGLAAGLIHKLDAGLWRRYGGPEDGERALALVKANALQLDVALENQGVVFKKSRALVTTSGAFKNEARSRGHQAARGIEVNAGVAAGNKVAGVLA
ncbi:MAG TPA: DUF2786 domain-containing protein [Azospirillum sp.]|nr:DUF2786 domain-containing protein [Azospirillum sp.]